MNKQTHFTARVIRFRRWSRARYAVFVSLSCAVTIGVLAVSVSDKSQLKSNAFISVNHLFGSDENTERESTEVSLAEIVMLQENIVVNQNNDNAAARSLNFLYSNVTVELGCVLIQPFFIFKNL